MIEILRKIFEANPDKSTIVIKDKCSKCGCDTIVEITPTSEGFGLQGGVLFKSSPKNYLVKCPPCDQTNPKVEGDQKKRKNLQGIIR